MNWISLLSGLSSTGQTIAQAIQLLLLLGALANIPLGCGYCEKSKEVQAKKKEIRSLKERTSEAEKDRDVTRKAFENEMILRKSQELALSVCVDRTDKMVHEHKMSLLRCEEGCEKRIRSEAEERMKKVRDMIRQFNPHIDDPNLAKKCPQKDSSELLHCLVQFILSDA